MTFTLSFFQLPVHWREHAQTLLSLFFLAGGISLSDISFPLYPVVDALYIIMIRH